MHRKQTIRTYERKPKKPLVDILLASTVISIQKHPDITKSCTLLDESNNESFLDHDPFETTFDRIAKGAVVPPLPLNENNSWDISSSDDTMRSIKSREYSNLFTFHDNIPTSISSSDNVKRPVRKCRQQLKYVEPVMTVSKGSVVCKNVKTEAQVFPDTLQLTMTKSNDSVEVSEDTPIKSQYNSNSFEINDRESNISWDKNNSTNEFMNETETKRNILSTNLLVTTTLSYDDVNVATISSKKTNNKEDLIKDCFVKLERLKVEQEEKNETEIIDVVQSTTVFSKKKKRHMICSTPINNKYIRVSVYPEAFSPVESCDITFESRLEYPTSTDNKLDIVSSDQKNFLFTSECCNIMEKQEETQVSENMQTAVTDIKKELMIPTEYDTSAIITNNQSRSLFSDNTDDKLELESVKAAVSLHPSSGDRKQQSKDVNVSECALSTKPCVSMTESTENKKELLENENICIKMETYIRGDSQDIETYEICESDEMTNISKEQQHHQQRAFGRNIDETLQWQDPIKITEKITQHAKCSQNIIEINLSSGDDDDVCPVIHSKVAESSNNNEDFNNRSSYSPVQNNIEDFNDRINSPVEKDLIQLNSSNNSCMEESQVFLKPGKSWMRSLSILNNIKDGVNLHKLSVGKGKKWRQSVKDVLEMQKQGILHDCSKKDLYPLDADVSSLKKDNECNKAFTPNRLSKRISMVRVVPSNISSDLRRDTSFFVRMPGRRTTAARNEDYPEFELCQGEKSDFEYNEISCRADHVTTAKDIVLRRCSQRCYQPFSECFPDSYLKHCRKIGEGVYGEVFLYQCEDEVSVIKIIPIEGEQLVNGELQKKFSEILSEIVIAEELHKLRDGNTYRTDGFVELKSTKCIIGRYPKKLIKLWKKYDNEKKSDNDCPSMFDENQLYIVLELGHGGEDLESFVFEDARETCALFLQAAFTLAIAEKALEFEHRDMHWGNILISRTNDPYVRYTIDGKEIEVPNNGLKVSIIDFTLSRMSYNKGCCIYNDLALDPSLFTAHGDYQFDVYRLMRDKIENNWQKFEPYTNVLWLHYTVDKIITAVIYKRTRLKIHKQAIARLKQLKNSILNYDNTFDFVMKCDIMTHLQVELM